MSADAPTNPGRHKNPLIGWRSDTHGAPTTLILLRHGVTEHTVRKLFCGSGGKDPELNADGHAQAARAAAWIDELGGVDAVIASPLARTRQTGAAVADRLGLELELHPGFAEAAFGAWDGFGFAEIAEKWPAELEAWLASSAVAPPGGESFDVVDARVQAALDDLLRDRAGQTVVVASHVTPIKLMIRRALDAPMQSIYRMELAPASISTISWWPDGNASMRNFSLVPPEAR